MSTPTETILVLGASYAGLATSHQLLRSLPPTYTLTLLSPSTHAYWNIGSVRAVALDSAPGFGPQNSLLHEPILPGFAKYPSSQFTFLQGRAVSVNTSSNILTYQPLSDTPTEGGQEKEVEIRYSQLIVATGSRSPDWPFKSSVPLPELKQQLLDSQAKIAAAERIVIGGGGPTSVETAGEIATLFPEKKVTLVSGTSLLLPGVAPGKVAITAEKTLKQLGVELKKNIKVSHWDEAAKEVVLLDGEKVPADLYIPIVGLRPNSEFLPRELVDENGCVKINTHLRTTVDNIWALGDVTNVIIKQLGIIPVMVPVVSSNVLKVIREDETKVELELKSYDEGKVMSMIFVPIGGKFGKGTGHVKGWKFPGVLVWAGKGRNFMVGGFKDIAAGRMMPGFSKV